MHAIVSKSRVQWHAARNGGAGKRHAVTERGEASELGGQRAAQPRALVRKGGFQGREQTNCGWYCAADGSMIELQPLKRSGAGERIGDAAGEARAREVQFGEQTADAE